MAETRFLGQVPTIYIAHYNHLYNLVKHFFKGLSQLGKFDLDIRMNASQRFSVGVAFPPKADLPMA